MLNRKLVRFLSAAAVVVAIPVAIAARPAAKLANHTPPMHTQTPKVVSTSHVATHGAPSKAAVGQKATVKKQAVKKSVRHSRHVRSSSHSRTHLRATSHSKPVVKRTKSHSSVRHHTTAKPKAAAAKH